MVVRHAFLIRFKFRFFNRTHRPHTVGRVSFAESSIECITPSAEYNGFTRLNTLVDALDDRLARADSRLVILKSKVSLKFCNIHAASEAVAQPLTARQRVRVSNMPRLHSLPHAWNERVVF